ncbi:hypothetical protein [Pseudomonas sp. MWU16-30317]|uniref:hypothetical protein n=1 Tax=Pseudomonas sp. MWU16-30317 TaxID=2878095 RepID=UPI001CFA35CA|nr:hypothetical protein [Pseudomonas sp. MWU16-30317]
MSEQLTNEVLAKQAADGLSPELKAAALIAAVKPYSALGEVPIIEEIRRQIEAARGGDMSRGHAMLVAQAETLDVLFYSLASKARAANDYQTMAELLCVVVKAVEGCRSALEGIAAITSDRH